MVNQRGPSCRPYLCPARGRGRRYQRGGRRRVADRQANVTAAAFSSHLIPSGPIDPPAARRRRGRDSCLMVISPVARGVTAGEVQTRLAGLD